MRSISSEKIVAIIEYLENFITFVFSSKAKINYFTLITNKFLREELVLTNLANK